MGGTLPLFAEGAGSPAIVVPVANRDNDQHAPDENLRIANLGYAIDLYAALMTMPTRVFRQDAGDTRPGSDLAR